MDFGIWQRQVKLGLFLRRVGKSRKLSLRPCHFAMDTHSSKALLQIRVLPQNVACLIRITITGLSAAVSQMLPFALLSSPVQQFICGAAV